MPYQSFGSVAGCSQSEAKYQALKLDTLNLDGKACLDIGCNEGFFCGKMKELGAQRCDGLDKTASWIQLAKQRFAADPSLRFYVMDCMDFKSETKYDCVLILSALHYMDASKVFPRVRELLQDGGVFVFEGGVIMNSTKAEWRRIDRKQDIVTHPTQQAFEALARQHFSKVVLVGPSVNQVGDPIDRFVYHCFK